MTDIILSLWPLAIALGVILALPAVYLRGHGDGFRQGKRYAVEVIGAKVRTIAVDVPPRDRDAELDRELDRELGK